MIGTYKISRSSAFITILVVITIISVLFQIIAATIDISISSYLVAYVISICLIFIFIKSSIRLGGSLSRVLLYLLFLYYLFTNYYTISLYAAQEKTLFLVYADLIPLLLLNLFFLFSKNPLDDIFQKQEILYKVSMGIIFLLFFLYTVGFTESIGTREMIKGMRNPIWAGRFYAFLSLLVTYYVFSYKKYSVLNLLAIVCGVFLTYTAGSRGPLFAYSMITTFIMWKYSNKLVMFIFIFCFVFLLMLVVGNRGAGAVSSNLGRLDYLYFILNIGNTNLLGYGIGSFGVLFLDKDVIFYPHNLILELYIEGGLPLLITIVILFFDFFRRFELNYISIVVVFFMINSMFSGDITSNNFLFIFLFIFSYVPKGKYNKKRLQIQIT